MTRAEEFLKYFSDKNIKKSVHLLTMIKIGNIELPDYPLF